MLMRRGLAACFAAALLAAGTIAVAGERFSFHGTPGRLPKDAVPLHYTLRVVPEAAKERFEGRVEIEIEVARAIDSLTLNAAAIEVGAATLHSPDGRSQALAVSVDSAQELLTLGAQGRRIAPGRHRLSIDYTGRIGPHPQGLHHIRYKVREGEALVDKVILATQFEPVHARRFFPGWDEPAFRASFELTVEIDEALTAVSNMPVRSMSARGGGRKEVAFERSVSMPTYLVALAIGEFDKVEDEAEGIRLGIYSVRGKSARARFALDATKEILRYFNAYFGERYPLSKLDQVALPGGFAGAMENWGAIFYNEPLLLADPKASALQDRQRVFGVVAHEIAHQWFGNLVTTAWWDDLWLNEGFATWMAGKAADRLHPEWRGSLRRAARVEIAKGVDARSTTRAVQAPLEQESRATDIFDPITYEKGMAFIQMLEQHLGADTFRDGIRAYLRAHRFSNATSEDLWHHLAAASGADVRQFAVPWIVQPGFPVVMVAQRCDGGRGIAALAQKRFSIGEATAKPQVWPVPLTLITGSGERRKLLLDAAPQQIHLPDCSIARVLGDGFYRVSYDPSAQREIARAWPSLDATARYHLLVDTYALVQAGRAGIADFLRLLDGMEMEDDRSVLGSVLGPLAELRDWLDGAAERAAFDRYVTRVLSRPFRRVGWDVLEGEDPERAALRAALVRALGLAGDAVVVREARARYGAQGGQPLDPALLPAVLDVIGRHADAETFESLLAQLRQATDVERRWQLQSALRHAADPALHERWLQMMLGNEVPPGEALHNLMESSAASGNRERAWAFVRANLPAIAAKASPRGRAYLLPRAAGPFADAGIADELLALAKQHLDARAWLQAEKAAVAIRQKAATKAREVRALVEWIGAAPGR